MTPLRIDLHLHSTASDGGLSPSEVVYFALRRRLDVIALTDHDTVDGIAEARAAAQGAPLTVISGIELSTLQPDGRLLDLLGYLFDSDDPAFRARLTDMRNGRQVRAAAIVDRLAALGVPISLERVYHLAAGGSVGRPHIARALVEAGYVITRQEAFARYIGDDGPAYIPHRQFTVAEGIALLHAAGGVAVLAHPCRVEDYEARIGEWVDQGLDGLEVYYPGQDVKSTRTIARAYGLIMTGGSDFHRSYDEDDRIGSVDVPGSCVADLQERAARYRP
jgi:hypothetical protein